MPVTPDARLARPRRWPGVVAWTLWALAMAVWLVIPWLDDRLRQAGRPDLTQWDLRPGVAAVSAATVGAVLASRRPRHPVGWLLLAQVAANLATGGCCPVPGLGTTAGWAPASHPRGGPGLPGQRRWRAASARLCPAVDPDRDAALAPLALVGQGHGGRTTAAGGAGAAGTRTGRPLRPGARQPLRVRRPEWGAAGRQPAGPGLHHPGRGGLRRVAGGALPPRPGSGAPAAALGGLGGGAAGGGGGGGRAGRPGPGRHRGGHLGAQCLGGRATTGP